MEQSLYCAVLHPFINDHQKHRELSLNTIFEQASQSFKLLMLDALGYRLLSCFTHQTKIYTEDEQSHKLALRQFMGTRC